jgi:hypothetical protein
MITIFVKYSQFSNLHQFVYEFALDMKTPKMQS